MPSPCKRPLLLCCKVSNSYPVIGGARRILNQDNTIWMLLRQQFICIRLLFPESLQRSKSSSQTSKTQKPSHTYQNFNSTSALFCTRKEVSCGLLFVEYTDSSFFHAILFSEFKVCTCCFYRHKPYLILFCFYLFRHLGRVRWHVKDPRTRQLFLNEMVAR